MSEQIDVVIIGGGLAGLSLSIQLKQLLPEIAVTVIEKLPHPVPAAAHKVGESTVEIGAHYFGKILRLEQHLQEAQLPKLGLRFFFPHGDNGDISKRFELGGSDFLPQPSYQLDRGIFENFLGEESLRLGNDFISDAKVDHLVLGEENAPHEVYFTKTKQQHIVRARWIVDASGRAGLLKHHLDLAGKNGHDVNAAWFRINRPIDINDWSDNIAWRNRNRNGRTRKLSTNHLMGEGYWVWLIPLASGSTSIGIVADGKIHPLSEFNRLDRALSWMRKFEPQCAEILSGILDEDPDALQDFLALKHYSHGAKQVYSGKRWCLSGEAGTFLDPFYSPGSDFIAISNTFIVDLIRRELGGESVGAVARLYDEIYLSLFENTLKVFLGQYHNWGNPSVMLPKIVWDYAYYWAVLGQLFFQDRLCDLKTYQHIMPELDALRRLNDIVQSRFKSADLDAIDQLDGRFVDMTKIDFLFELNRGLGDRLEHDEFVLRFGENAQLLRKLSHELIESTNWLDGLLQ